MAEFAQVTGRRMVARFTGRTAGAVVTTVVAAAGGELAMIERHLSPTCGADVTVFTGQSRGDVRWTLARGNTAIVASAAHSGSLTVDKRHNQRQPARISMTGFAGIGG